jgi:hypothetical protein
MTRPLGEGESQAANAERLRRVWEQGSLHGVPQVGAVITHEIERVVTPLDGGGERVEIKLHPPTYRAGPAAARSDNRPPTETRRVELGDESLFADLAAAIASAPVPDRCALAQHFANRLALPPRERVAFVRSATATPDGAT